MSQTKQRYIKKLKQYLELRTICAQTGSVNDLQTVNYEIARLAAKLKIDYYSV